MDPRDLRRRRRWPKIVLSVLVLGVLGIGLLLVDPWRRPPDVQGPNPTTLDGILKIAEGGPDSTGSLAAYWQAKLSEADPSVAFHPPAGFAGYEITALPESPCRESFQSNNAYYCPDDRKIFWHEAWFETIDQIVGPVATLGIMAHEYGHHISNLLRGLKGTGEHFSKREELQADCFAGMYLREANKVLGLPNYGLLGQAYTLYRIGDRDSSSPWFSEGVHGSGIERLGALSRGFILNNLKKCETYQQYHSELIVKVGPYRMAVTPGTKIDRTSDDLVRVTDVAGHDADVSFQKGDGSPQKIFEEYINNLFEFDADTSDVEFAMIGSRQYQDLQRPWDSHWKQRYELSFVKAGEREVFHGIGVLFVLENGEAIGFNTFRSGSVSSTDETSWNEMDRQLSDLQAGIWPHR